jgi:hypothetical protein
VLFALMLYRGVYVGVTTAVCAVFACLLASCKELFDDRILFYIC